MQNTLFNLAVENNLVPSDYFESWDEFSEWQFRFLVKKIRIPTDTQFLDIGCGSLRLGYLLIPYLKDDCYCGLDAFEPFINLGNDLMKHVGNQKRYYAICSSDFNFDSFDRTFDVAFAHSVLGHLSRQQNRRCFEELKKVMTAGGKFYGTVALSGKGRGARPGFFYGGITPFRKPSFTSLDYLVEISEELGISAKEIDSDHQQKMMEFTF